MYAQIQITKNCNLACHYCFQDHSDKTVMKPLVLKTVIDRCIDYQLVEDPERRRFLFTWHGGEPLLAGVRFFEKILHIQAGYPYAFDNRVQTNGAAMTIDMARLLGENHFDVSFSLDGPEDIHDRHRVLANNRGGSFGAVMAGIEKFRRYNDRNLVNIISVVSRYTVDQGATRFYRFFRDLRTNLQFQPYDLTLADLQKGSFSPADNPVVAEVEDYASFVIDLFDLWFYDDPLIINISDLKNEIKSILLPRGGQADIAQKKRCPADRTIIDPHGLVYSCDMYVNRPETALGDICREPLPVIMERKYRLWEDIKKAFRNNPTPFRCQDCPYGSRCPGGCLTCMRYNYLVLKGEGLGNAQAIAEVNQYFERLFSDRGDAYFCPSFKIYRRHMEKKVQTEIQTEGLCRLEATN